ncbi:MAG: carboxymuconolactone decarboxylase family protein [Bacteroidota bacterium]
MSKEKHQTPRIAPQPVSDMREEWIKTIERIPGSGLKGLYAPVNVLGTLMYTPRTLGQFLDYWVTSKLEMGLSVREQELVILRMGYLYRSNYVWKHHVPVAVEFGVNERELEACKSVTVPEDVFSLRETALLVLTDEMMEHRTIRQEIWEKWSDELDKPVIIDLISLISQYVLFALVNNVMQVEIESPLHDMMSL